MKIAISGKGGVGKTTLSAALTGAMAMDGRVVVAIDADPDSNLASSLGVSDKDQPTPIAAMREMIRQRTGAENSYGGYFKLNPKVDDIGEKYSLRIGSIRLLTLGGVSRGGGGCICPASALVKALLTHLVIGGDDAVIMDMEAGIEHLGRATAQSMDAIIVVVDDGKWSCRTARKVAGLAADIGLKKIFAVANRVTDKTNVSDIQKALEPIPLIGKIPYDRRLADGPVCNTDDSGGFTPSEALTDMLGVIRKIISSFCKEIGN